MNKPTKKSKEKWENEITSMFDKIANKYDCINKFISLGMDKRWRTKLLDNLQKYYHSGEILDVGCGTGSLSKLAKDKAMNFSITSMDISPKMLEIAQKSGNADKILCASASQIPLQDKECGAIISAFVLRNLPNLDLFYKEANRILNDKGILVLLDLTRPTFAPIRLLHKLYMKIALPLTALIFRSNISAYQYLNQSINNCFQSQKMDKFITQNGFEKIKIQKLFFGTVTLYTYRKNTTLKKLDSIRN